MNQTVSRLYPTVADAERVADLLAWEGLGRREMRIDPTPAGASTGAARLSIQSPFGSTTRLMKIMDREGALKEGRDVEREYYAPYDNAAPFSEALGIPAIGGRGDMFSRWLGIATLTNRGAPTGSSLLVREGTGGYKGLFGLPLLIRSASYKGFLRLPLLSGGSASYKGTLGLPFLSRSSTGSNRGFLGLPLLAGGGAPYRSFLRLPLLKRDSRA